MNPKEYIVPDESDDISSFNTAGSMNPAADMIRSKLSAIYGQEPDAAQEALDIIGQGSSKKLSKHQKIILSLTNSEKSMAEMQTEWHQYYAALPDSEKHEVWREFYEAHAKSEKALHSSPIVAPDKVKIPSPIKKSIRRTRAPYKVKTLVDMQGQILKIAGSNKQISKRQHLHSVFFGLSMGALVILIIMFSFFNERFIAPFITPSRVVTNTPIISDVSAAVSPEPKVIIPKINVEVPVDFNIATIDEKAIQNSLENGAVHYADTVQPGEIGNAVIVGHSSSNIFNKGKYKFAFVLLGGVQVGDTFMIHKDSKQYIYKVYERKIIKPTELDILKAQSRPATATLITCDPPGTSVNRLVVVGEQISPDPSVNVASKTAGQISSEAKTIPGNAPSLWSRLFN